MNTPISSGPFAAGVAPFGVATSLEYQLHPIGPTITGGLVAHPFDRAAATLRFFRDCTASLPDDHTIFAGLIHAPDGSGAKLATMAVTADHLPRARQQCGRSSNLGFPSSTRWARCLIVS
jgi:FAD/FMN-containing dehydrogenase